MNILFLTKNQNRSHSFSLGRNGIIAILAGVFVLLPLMGGIAGYRLGTATSAADSFSAGVAQEMEQQRRTIEEARRLAQSSLDALALRLGQMQAHVIRLDALGQRLTRLANLKGGEFNFEKPPAQGGPVTSSAPAETIAITDFVALLDELSLKLDDRSQQLDVLESMLINRNLQAEITPGRAPAKSGWISSFFGMRTDPFSGRPERHYGIDFAGKEGSDVVAAGSGVVTWAGQRSGYGLLVEVDHGNGYVTRYGHSKKILVRVGEPIRKGQVLASMGSTGRSTGPHVHFEVLRNGVAVDPLRYIRAAN